MFLIVMCGCMVLTQSVASNRFSVYTIKFSILPESFAHKLLIEKAQWPGGRAVVSQLGGPGFQTMLMR